MKGSEKQVSWATDIREAFRAAVHARIDEIISENDDRRADGEAHRSRMMDAIDKIDDAKFWIDNRRAEWSPHDINEIQTRVLRAAK